MRARNFGSTTFIPALLTLLTLSSCVGDQGNLEPGALGDAAHGETSDASDVVKDSRGPETDERDGGEPDTSPRTDVADAPATDVTHDDAPGDAPVDAPVDAPAGWVLTWSDEFGGADGSAVDATKWNYDVGAGESGWGNNELEYYTSGTDNAVVRGGSLVITATNAGASKYKCSYGPCKFVSARLTTSGKFAQKYGRFEARMKLPRGKGVWPAFWMLGQNFPATDWPDCGEIDVMENIGDEPSICHGTTHGPGPASYVDVGLTGQVTLPGGKALADDFHVYTAEWEASAVRFYFDGALYKTVTSKDLPSGAKWVWDHSFFVLLNFAVGGDWPGSPDASTKWPQTMEVDYVRVYRAE